MSKRGDTSDQKEVKYCIIGTRKRDVRTHRYAAEEQFGAKTWATAKQQNKETTASGAATGRRAIWCPKAL
jgi:hypothetical protein